MRYPIILISFFLFALGGYCLESPIPGYEVIELEWDVQAFQDGPTIQLNGTVQQVWTQLIKHNPNISHEFPIPEHPQESHGTLSSDYTTAGHSCFGRWDVAGLQPIRDGIAYLRRIGGRPRNRPGPSACGRVSCSWNAAIWWCNDNHEDKTLGSFSNIADAAQEILRHCTIAMTCSGQWFYTDKWNVIVRRDTDHC